jgi:hypothetical protein
VKKDGKLYVYESTSKDVIANLIKGCKLREWNDFVRYSWHVLYEKMVFRKLIFKRDDDKKDEFIKKFDKNLNEFIDVSNFIITQSTKGKPYRLTCNKLCCSKARTYEVSNNWGECKGFYCSQLVSAGLMKLNVIGVTKGAGQYLPGNKNVLILGAFAEESDLGVTEDYEYGPEVIIDFSL